LDPLADRVVVFEQVAGGREHVLEVEGGHRAAKRLVAKPDPGEHLTRLAGLRDLGGRSQMRLVKGDLPLGLTRRIAARDPPDVLDRPLAQTLRALSVEDRDRASSAQPFAVGRDEHLPRRGVKRANADPGAARSDHLADPLGDLATRLVGERDREHFLGDEAERLNPVGRPGHQGAGLARPGPGDYAQRAHVFGGRVVLFDVETFEKSLDAV
jgi:hypothetical protein